MQLEPANPQTLPVRTLNTASFFFAFCSLVYELLLSQAMSITYGSTNQSYIYVVGCYLFGMGAGAWISDKKIISRHPLQALLRAEYVLCALFLFGFYFILLTPSFLDFSSNVALWGSHAFALLLCTLIGIMTGFEVPLLLQLSPPTQSARILALDYVGGFLASLLFIYFIPFLGLIRTAHMTPLINLAVCWMLLIQNRNISRKTTTLLSLVCGILTLLFICADMIEVWIRMFLFF